jgi:hypothetical protein
MPHFKQQICTGSLCPCRAQLTLIDAKRGDERNVFRLCESINYR